MWFLVGLMVLIPTLLLGWAGWVALMAVGSFLGEILPLLLAIVLGTLFMPFTALSSKREPWKKSSRQIKKEVLAGTVPWRKG